MTDHIFFCVCVLNQGYVVMARDMGRLIKRVGWGLEV